MLIHAEAMRVDDARILEHRLRALAHALTEHGPRLFLLSRAIEREREPYHRRELKRILRLAPRLAEHGHRVVDHLRALRHDDHAGLEGSGAPLRRRERAGARQRGAISLRHADDLLGPAVAGSSEGISRGATVR